MREERKKLYVLLAAVALAVLVAVLAGPGQEREMDEPAPTAEPTATPAPTPTPEPPYHIAGQASHPALLDMPEDGLFRPDGLMARGEMVRALARLVDGLEVEGAAFVAGPVTDCDERYTGAAVLTAAGLAQQDDFRPEWPMSRREAGTMLRTLAGRLAGPAKDLARSWAGELTGGGYLTRREAALILEDLSGRVPLEEDRLFLGGCMPSDMTREDDDWIAVTDAVTEGLPPWREEGVYRLYGWVYAADEDGALVRDSSVGVWSFGPDGGYTTGDSALDERLAKALKDSGADALTGRKALEAVYLYVKNNFEYKVTPQDQVPEQKGTTGWEFGRASRFFRYGGGTCYGYAATFGLLARCLGEDAKIVAATVNQFYAPHSFVVIPEDGTDWIYDVELEDARPWRHGDLALFRMENFSIYSYWYTPDW